MVNRDDVSFFLPIPFSDEERSLDRWHSNNYQMMARLRPGASIEQALAQIDALTQSLIEQWTVPGARQLLEDAGYTSRCTTPRKMWCGTSAPCST